MATRRHVGVNGTATPSKDDLRRRLFQTPQKSLKTSRRQGDQSHLRAFLSRRVIQIFVGVGALFLLIVHFYLYQGVVAEKVDVQGQAVGGDSSLVSNTPHVPYIPKDSLLRGRTATLRKRLLQDLQEKDWNQYTIRINTWRRPEQLLLSVDWHSKCPGVAQIQIVWCDKEQDPPVELQDYDNVVVEHHEANTLNERFNILTPTPTLGILSIDDDVIRPCEAIDAGFFKWTQSPDRMVGFDGRLHVENENEGGSWQYGYLSTTEKANRYSLSLTRYCFLHRDYMDVYMRELPSSMLDQVAANFNCEDVAMTFLISSLTDGKPPLLADMWAIKSMIKLHVEKKISGGHDHKKLRDECVDSFAQLLGLKDDGQRRLKSAALYQKKNTLFDCGDTPHHISERHPESMRQTALHSKMREWHKPDSKMQKEVHRLMSMAGLEAYKHGLMENTDRWRDRFLHKNSTAAH